jgi:3-oxoacyl-[acyl-carrier-protein] synthase II
MSSVVITGSGLVTAAGRGSSALLEAMKSRRSFVRPHDGEPFATARVSKNVIVWPDAPDWLVGRDYAAWGTELAVTAASQALVAANAAAGAVDKSRAATITVARDEWTYQEALDNALCRAGSPRDEARALFEQLDDQFLARTFRWVVGYTIASLSGFSGPSSVVDPPTFGGLSGLRQAADLIESGEVDAVLLVGVDAIVRSDTFSAFQALAGPDGATVALGQGAAALMLERESNALSRGAPVLARVLGCEMALDASLERALHRLRHRLPASQRADLRFGWQSGVALEDQAEQAFFQQENRRVCTATAQVGLMLNAGALVHLCLASDWLNGVQLPGVDAALGSAAIVAFDTYFASGVGGAVVAAPER